MPHLTLIEELLLVVDIISPETHNYVQLETLEYSDRNGMVYIFITPLPEGSGIYVEEGADEFPEAEVVDERLSNTTRLACI